MYYNQVGKLAPLLRHLPLPAEHYYYHKNAVATLVSLGRICEEFRVVFDSGVHDAFYIFNGVLPNTAIFGRYVSRFKIE